MIRHHNTLGTDRCRLYLIAYGRNRGSKQNKELSADIPVQHHVHLYDDVPAEKSVARDKLCFHVPCKRVLPYPRRRLLGLVHFTRSSFSLLVASTKNEPTGEISLPLMGSFCSEFDWSSSLQDGSTPKPRSSILKRTLNIAFIFLRI